MLIQSPTCKMQNVGSTGSKWAERSESLGLSFKNMQTAAEWNHVQGWGILCCVVLKSGFTEQNQFLKCWLCLRRCSSHCLPSCSRSDAELDLISMFFLFFFLSFFSSPGTGSVWEKSTRCFTGCRVSAILNPNGNAGVGLRPSLNSGGTMERDRRGARAALDTQTDAALRRMRVRQNPTPANVTVSGFVFGLLVAGNTIQRALWMFLWKTQQLYVASEPPPRSHCGLKTPDHTASWEISWQITVNCLLHISEADKRLSWQLKRDPSGCVMI